MQSLEERAKSYAVGCELQGKEARKAEFDYIAGAKEERILLTGWRDAVKILPEVGKRVLCKLLNGYIAVGVYRADRCWRLDGFGAYALSTQVKWRPIHEFEPTKVYYGDDDGRAE